MRISLATEAGKSVAFIRDYVFASRERRESRSQAQSDTEQKIAMAGEVLVVATIRIMFLEFHC